MVLLSLRLDRLCLPKLICYEKVWWLYFDVVNDGCKYYYGNLGCWFGDIF